MSPSPSPSPPSHFDHRFIPISSSSRLYHDTTSSFAALATQSSMLSQSASALFDKDHPSMAGKGTHSMQFKELKPDQLAALHTELEAVVRRYRAASTGSRARHVRVYLTFTPVDPEWGG